jgi:HEAT repeat protein
MAHLPSSGRVPGATPTKVPAHVLAERALKAQLKAHPGPKPGLLEAAKFPPDDDDVGGGAGAPGGMPMDPPGGGLPDPGDGNFKRGKALPVIIGLLVAGAIAGGIWFAAKKDQERLKPEQAARLKQNIFLLPQKEQIPEWRKWGASNEADMEQEALAQLAYVEDAEGPKLATTALANPDHKIRGVAAQVVAFYGSPRADGAKGALNEALKTADDSDEPQIVWALVVLKDKSVFTKAMELYRKGHLSNVQRLGGGSAFDPKLLSTLVSLDEFAKLADDPSPSVRQLVATVLSENADAKWTAALTKLVQDKDVEVAREAATGLGKIGDEKARDPLLKKLAEADKESRKKFLEALRDGIGGEGLVLALSSIDKSKPETEWFQTEQIFNMLEEVADPRIGDSLVKWVESTNPTPHWRGQAGLRLAEVGDIRGAKYLGDRMKEDPTKLYKPENFWEHDAGGHLSKSDGARVVSARMLADLAALYPDKKADLIAAAEQPVLDWATSRPQPHANALRFLANVKSDKVLPQMRKWAFPDDKLPKEGQQPPFPDAFATAQSALRYIGKMQDTESYDKLLKQLKRKDDKKMDITQKGLEGAGLAMLGMALRSVAYGASQGLGEWGDPRANKPFMEFIEDETWHEEARQAACENLAWTADPDTMKEVAKKAAKYTGDKDEKKRFIGACYSVTLSLRPMPEVVGTLVDLLTPELEPQIQLALAQAIGASPLDDANKAKLFEKMKNVETRNAAALALILGGDTDTAARAVAQFGDLKPEALNDLKDAYFRAFGFWSDEDFKKGNIYRWVENAEMIAHLKLFDAPQEWAIERLSAQFDNLKFDNGPHSQTRVVLRFYLNQAAKTGDDKVKVQAIRTLKFMKEKGSLMALRHEQGLTGELASKAFHELMNPKPIVPEDLSKLQKEQAEKMKEK